MLVENSGRLVDGTSLLGLWNYEPVLLSQHKHGKSGVMTYVRLRCYLLERMKRQKHSFE